jgi:tRNA(Ile2) C34 agmatinyltransferase TiaS
MKAMKIHIQTVQQTTEGTAMNCKECGQELKEVGEMDEYQLCHPCYCTVMDTTTNKGDSND